MAHVGPEVCLTSCLRVRAMWRATQWPREMLGFFLRVCGTPRIESVTCTWLKWLMDDLKWALLPLTIFVYMWRHVFIYVWLDLSTCVTRLLFSLCMSVLVCAYVYSGTLATFRSQGIALYVMTCIHICVTWLVFNLCAECACVRACMFRDIGNIQKSTNRLICDDMYSYMCDMTRFWFLCGSVCMRARVFRDIGNIWKAKYYLWSSRSNNLPRYTHWVRDNNCNTYWVPHM